MAKVIRQGAREAPSMFVMRAYVACLEEMGDRELVAMIGWLNSKTASVLKERRAEKAEAPNG